ncbi:hypothetical protein [Paenibacillus riograndensis]|uniref:Secreted protein n=1 Tax=Paenibacillus riograndensis SBR5 TaxID=1073571 RepID=A0A0E4HDY9_9BACL|nr:hypothetical protein [Paenibacillus riograndensis]CQR58641.1 hypothetical protein PRIO_6294 [Paenibacillus riograndensis SBR5]
MKPAMKVSMAVVLLGGAVWAGSLMNLTAEGASVGNQPGTADDPVVTKSYVDQQIQKALGGGTTATNPPAATATASPAPTATSSSSPQTSAPANSNEAVIVDVKPGQTLFGSAGAEFIVRAGKAVIFSEAANGVADLTDGKDLADGQAAPMNHLLSFPRDGRGIKVQDGQTLRLVVMVRGRYTLK